MDQIAFQCACGRRLKAPPSAIGKTIECNGCGVHVVVPERSSFGDMIQIGGETINTAKWIRAKCSCGKVLKAPPKMAGTIGRCPRCGERVKMSQPTPEDNFSGASAAGATALEMLYEQDRNNASRMAPVDAPTRLAGADRNTNRPDAPFDPAKSAHLLFDPRQPNPKSPDAASADNDKSRIFDLEGSRGPGGPAKESAQGEPADYLRVTCTCGKIVKAPLSMSGKIGKCPKCGNSLVMPYAPRKSTSIPEPMVDGNLGNEGSATAVGFEAESEPVDPSKSAFMVTPSGSAPVNMPPEVPPTELQGSDASESKTDLPSDFVLKAPGESTKAWEKKRRAKLYQDSKVRGGMSSVLKMGFKDLLMLPLSLFSAGSNMSPAMASVIGVAMLSLAMGIMIYNWPQDYVDAQRRMPVPRRYYYSLSENRLLELADVDFERITKAMATTQPDGASYMARAYVYACGSCDTDTRQVLFLERFTPAAQKATLEFEDLIDHDKGSTDQTKSLAGIIESGHFIGRFLEPTPMNHKPVPGATTTPSTQPAITLETSAASKSGSDSKATSNVSSTSQPAVALERPALLDKIKWVTYVSGSSMLNNPLPSCKNNLNQCLPEPKK